MKCKICIATESLDSEGDIIKIDGIKLNGVPLVKDFDLSKFIGKVTPYIKDNRLMADVDIEGFENLYPAIGFSVKQCNIRNDGEVRIIEKAMLHSVSFCQKPNVDSSIKKIGEQ